MRFLMATGIAAAVVLSDDMAINGNANVDGIESIESVGLLQKAQRDNMSVTHATVAEVAAFCCHSQYNDDGNGGQPCSNYVAWCEGESWCGGRCNHIPDFACTNKGDCDREAKNRASPEPSPSPNPPSPNGCSGFQKTFKRTNIEDCTNKPMFEWLKEEDGSVNFSPPDQDLVSNDFWKTTEGYLRQNPSTCVAYVTTQGSTCNDFCTENDKECVWAQDDAHHQTAQLSGWLTNNGKEATDCTVRSSGKDQLSCNQKWQTQICACK